MAPPSPPQAAAIMATMTTRNNPRSRANVVVDVIIFPLNGRPRYLLTVPNCAPGRIADDRVDMPEIMTAYNDELARRLRAEQEDPLVMYIVVPKSTKASFHELAISTARATRRCVDELRAHPVWADAFAEW